MMESIKMCGQKIKSFKKCGFLFVIFVPKVIEFSPFLTDKK